MRRGIKPEMFSNFKKGQPQQWYSSNPANSSTYSGPRGMQFYAAPVKTNKTNIQPITTSKANASSNHWTSDKMDPISRHIKGDTILLIYLKFQYMTIYLRKKDFLQYQVKMYR